VRQKIDAFLQNRSGDGSQHATAANNMPTRLSIIPPTALWSATLRAGG
jgi:hypothetical protein